jgi:hypothetical protein
MHPPAQATRRAQVVEALADAVPAVDHAPPIHVAVDGLDDPATRAFADDLDRRLSDRGRRCRRVTLDALSLLHPAGPGVERPAHRAGPGDDLVVVDGCFLQHPEFLGAWDLVVFLRSDPPGPPGPYGDPDQATAAARSLTQVDPEGTADVVVDLHDPGWPLIRRMSPLLADRLGPGVFLAETRPSSPRAATWEQRFPDDDPAYAPPSPRSACTPGRPPWTRAAAPAGPCATCGPRSARPVGSSASTSPRRCWPAPAPTVATPTPCSPWPPATAGVHATTARPVPHNRRANLPVTLPRCHAVDVGLAELRRPDRAQGRRHALEPGVPPPRRLLEAPAEVAVGIL